MKNLARVLTFFSTCNETSGKIVLSSFEIWNRCVRAHDFYKMLGKWEKLSLESFDQSGKTGRALTNGSSGCDSFITFVLLTTLSQLGAGTCEHGVMSTFTQVVASKECPV